MICKPWLEWRLTCVVRIMLYRSSLGAGAGLGSGAGAGAGAGLLTKVNCLMLPLRLLVLDLGSEESRALWSSSRRAWAVATSSKNSSVCSEVMEEKTTRVGETGGPQWYSHLSQSVRGQSAPPHGKKCNCVVLTSVCRFGGVGLWVAPPPPDAGGGLQAEGAALVVEPPSFLQGAQQLIQSLREVRG